MAESDLEETWLYHEIGRCHLELENYDQALSFGQQSMTAAVEAKDNVWRLNACVLMAQAEGIVQFHLTHSLQFFVCEKIKTPIKYRRPL